MNWTCLVYGAPMLAVLVWWFVDARRWFKGPKINVEHVVHGVTVEGVDPSSKSVDDEPVMGGSEIPEKVG